MDKALKNKDLYISVVVTLLIIGANILDSKVEISSNLWLLHGILIGISQSIGLIAFIILMSKPIVGLNMMICSEIILVINEVISGTNFTKALENGSITLEILIFGAFFNWLWTDINNKKVKGLDKTTISEMKNSFLIKRKLFKVKGWVRIIIYSTLITVVMTIATSAVLEVYGDSTEIKIILALSLLVPVFINIAAVLNSIVTIELLVLKVIVEGVVLSYIINIDSNVTAKIIFFLAELFTVIYCVVKLFIGEEKEKEHGKIKENQETNKDSEEKNK